MSKVTSNYLTLLWLWFYCSLRLIDWACWYVFSFVLVLRHSIKNLSVMVDVKQKILELLRSVSQVNFVSRAVNTKKSTHLVAKT